MDKMLNKDYSYNFLSFEALEVSKEETDEEPKKVRYDLIGTECEEGNKVYDCIDTFKNKEGKYLRIRRKLIMNKQQKNKITPIEESRVIVKQYSKKEEKLRR